MSKSSASRPAKAQRKSRSDATSPRNKPRSKDVPHLHVQPNPGFAQAFFEANAEILKQAARNAKKAQEAEDALKAQKAQEARKLAVDLSSDEPPAESKK